jgi:hypothetical protein
VVPKGSQCPLRRLPAARGARKGLPDRDDLLCRRVGVRWIPSWPKVNEALYGYAEAVREQSFDAI